MQVGACCIVWMLVVARVLHLVVYRLRAEWFIRGLIEERREQPTVQNGREQASVQNGQKPNF